MSNSTRQEFHKAMLDIQLTHNVSQNESNTWAWSVFTKSKMQTTIAMDSALGIHILCYSSNLHFGNDSEEPEIFESTLVDPMYEFELLVPAEEAIFIERPTVTFAVHSPFLVDNTTLFKDKLNLGSSYDISIRLEEEHFLPYPFQTDCMDYTALWEANDRKGARSQYDCKSRCWDLYYDICEGCEVESEVFEEPEICTEGELLLMKITLLPM
ncbi:uncharacterized protein TNIN_130291 [Trichonephila inaurata madagascariensis]|uniref:Uncharacterized protein n=1 Tax=Trichonephila inaurata madagascariensis TaxID=2747483 RepID=A0A8X6KPG7_9ARAC|nr:uncharacterized protein TNIN_130291 [Trichonephila inaurata madagascariensis]